MYLSRLMIVANWVFYPYFHARDNSMMSTQKKCGSCFSNAEYTESKDETTNVPYNFE